MVLPSESTKKYVHWTRPFNPRFPISPKSLSLWKRYVVDLGDLRRLAGHANINVDVIVDVLAINHRIVSVPSILSLRRIANRVM
jgi:hypothetical protein